MPTLTLLPHYHLKIPYNQPPLFGTVAYRTEAEYPVDIFVVDEQGLAAFEQGLRDFPIYDSVEGILTHADRLPRIRGQGYLIILNPSPRSTAVHYEIQ